jgi:acetyl-CoA synthetase
MQPSAGLENELVQTVVKVIGPTAKPEKIVLTDALPKTRSGKIMRRILKALAKNEPVGDTTTLMNPEAVDDLKKKVVAKA